MWRVLTYLRDHQRILFATIVLTSLVLAPSPLLALLLDIGEFLYKWGVLLLTLQVLGLVAIFELRHLALAKPVSLLLRTIIKVPVVALLIGLSIVKFGPTGPKFSIDGIGPWYSLGGCLLRGAIAATDSQRCWIVPWYSCR
jgi:hypothetical protein